MGRLIDEDDVIAEIEHHRDFLNERFTQKYGDADGQLDMYFLAHNHIIEVIKAKVPSAQPEPLTDKEMRIFLAAMWREEKVCEEVDRDYGKEPYEDSLMRVCKEIRRKVKGALWN